MCNWEKEKNLVINWESPKAIVTKQHQDLGTVQADPAAYVQLHANSLLSASQMESVLREHNISTPLRQQAGLPQLVGDLNALKMVDLDRWGLSEYKSYLGMSSSYQISSHQMIASSVEASSPQAIYEEVWKLAVVDQQGRIACEEGRRLINLILQKLGKVTDSSCIDQFIRDVCVNGSVDFEQFKRLAINWHVL